MTKNWHIGKKHLRDPKENVLPENYIIFEEHLKTKRK